MSVFFPGVAVYVCDEQFLFHVEGNLVYTKTRLKLPTVSSKPPYRVLISTLESLSPPYPCTKYEIPNTIGQSDRSRIIFASRIRKWSTNF